MGDPFQKLFAKFGFVYKHGSGEWGLPALYGHKEILKKSSSLKQGSDFEIISQKCPLDNSFQKLFAKFDPSTNMALMNGCFLCYRSSDMKKFIKNLLLRNRLLDFEIISQECYLCDPFQKLIAAF